MDKINPAQLINQDSGDYEYYTPIDLVDAAREVMGGIDLDPASSEKANELIGASHIFTAEMDWDNDGRLIDLNGGLEKDWFGKIWMNHPFARAESPCKENCQKNICKKRGYHTGIFLPGNAHWINKLVREYENGNIEEVCCITYASTSEEWFRPLLDYLQCFIHGRTNYFLPNGKKKKGVTKGSVITYLGHKNGKFEEVFSRFGTVK